MAFNCKLNRNITLADITGGDCSRLTTLTAGGIRERIYVFNIGDVDNLVFSGDTRVDSNLIIDTIVTAEPYYVINATSLAYSEEYEDGKWTHSLTGNVANIITEIEDILADGVNGKYLVCFKPNGEDRYKAFGWKEGASLTYSTEINEETSAYKIEFSDLSEYPLMGCESDNFSLADKVYTPTWNPLFWPPICESSSGSPTGYEIATYVLKVNSAGQALDTNNMLCEYSGLPQDAYKLSGRSDGDYNIVGTYNTGTTVYYDGKPNRKLNLFACPLNSDGSISVSPSDVDFDSNTRTSAFTLTSDNMWQLVNNPSHVIVSVRNGSAGQTIGTITAVEGGLDVLVFRNIATNAQATVNIAVNVIEAEGKTVSNGITEVTVPVVVRGSTSAYTVTTTEGTAIINADNSLTLSGISTSTDEKTITITLTHADDADEVRVITITISGDDATQAEWQIVSQWCEE